MRLIDFKQYLTSFITITLTDGTEHSGFVSNPDDFYSLKNDAVTIPDVRLMNGLMSDIVHFDDIDYIELADREDTLSLKMLLTEQTEKKKETTDEESDFQKMMDSLKRLVVKGKEDRPIITKATLLSKPLPETETVSRQHLTIRNDGSISLVSYNHSTGVTEEKTATVPEAVAQEILDLLYDTDGFDETSTHNGSFKLVLVVEGFENIRIYGPLNGSASANGILLTPFVKERIPLDSLVLFG